ncbi:MAG: nitroreductase family protein [Litorilinea sp.]
MADSQDTFTIASTIPKPASLTDQSARNPAAEFAHLARSRRSIRRYTTRPVDRSILEELLTSACWAPSAHNRQPWRFCVVTNLPVKNELSRRMGEQWRADLSADDADPNFIARRVAISHARITGAAALVIAALCMEDMDSYADALRNSAEQMMAVQSVALACQNLLLAAHAHGLGACWMCAPLFVPDLVRDVLDLPAHWEPQSLITLGYPAEEKTKERADPATRILWRE